MSSSVCLSASERSAGLRPPPVGRGGNHPARPFASVLVRTNDGVDTPLAADLTGGSLEQASMEDARLVKAVLRGANLEKADLLGADLSEADLSGANLVNVELSRARIEGAVLDDAQWINRRRCRPGSIGECR